MSNTKYARKDYDKENMARAIGTGLPISFKQSVEVCNFIRNKSLGTAKRMLSDVLKFKIAVPFKRFNADRGHKRGKIAAGRYPLKTCEEILSLLNSVEANAQFNGLSTGDLYVSHICAQRGPQSFHYGRQRRRRMKKTNVEIIVEMKKGAVKKQKDTALPKEAKKKEDKPKAAAVADKKADVKPAVQDKPTTSEKTGTSAKESPAQTKKSAQSTDVKKTNASEAKPAKPVIKTKVAIKEDKK